MKIIVSMDSNIPSLPWKVQLPDYAIFCKRVKFVTEVITSTDERDGSLVLTCDGDVSWNDQTATVCIS